MYNRYASAQPYQPLEPEEQSPSLLGRLLGNEKNAGLTGILQRLGIPQPDKGDLLLLAVLLFLYMESEDEEWLIILALVALTGFG